MPTVIGATGLNFSAGPLEVTLAGAQAFLVPSGNYISQCGPYTMLEWYDSNLGLWRNTGAQSGTEYGFQSDGTNYRMINRTGCPAGAIMTALGSGYTTPSAIVVTSSTGGSLWKAIVGGAFNSAITVTTAGNYAYPPTIIFPPPPAGGITATAHCTITSSVIASVTLDNRGAGYTNVPTSVAVNNGGTTSFNPQSNQIQIIQDPRDTLAGGGVITMNATLAAASTITAVLCTDPGTGTVSTVPTLAFSGGGGSVSSASAIVIMNWTVTGMTVNSGGAAYGNAAPFTVFGMNLLNSSTDAAGDLNPVHNLGIIIPRNFAIDGTTVSAGTITSANMIIRDAGFGIQQVPNGVVLAGSTSSAAAVATTAAQVSFTMGATTDTSFLQFRKV